MKNKFHYISFLIALTCSHVAANCPELNKLSQFPDGHWEGEDGWIGEERNPAYADAIPKTSDKIVNFYSVTISPRSIICSYLTDADEEIFMEFELKGKKAIPTNMTHWVSTKGGGQHWGCMVDAPAVDISYCPFTIK